MRTMRWGLATRLLVRDWRAGETMILVVALVVAVAAMSAVGLFTNRVRQAVTQQAGEVLASDLRLGSDYPITPEYERLAAEQEIQTAHVVNFRSVVLAGEASSLADVRGVTEGYPLRGEVRIADELAGHHGSLTAFLSPERCGRNRVCLLDWEPGLETTSRSAA